METTLKSAAKEIAEREVRYNTEIRPEDPDFGESEEEEGSISGEFHPTHTINGVPVMMVRTGKGLPTYVDSDGRRIYPGRGRPVEPYSGPTGSIKELVLDTQTLALCSIVASGRETYADNERGSSAHYREINGESFIELQLRDEHPPFFKRWLLRIPETIKVPAIELR